MQRDGSLVIFRTARALGLNCYSICEFKMCPSSLNSLSLTPNGLSYHVTILRSAGHLAHSRTKINMAAQQAVREPATITSESMISFFKEE